MTIKPSPAGGTTAAPIQTQCSFEQGTCGFTQDKTDKFDWTRDNGGTTSSNTGPAVDHTYGTNVGKCVVS